MTSALVITASGPDAPPLEPDLVAAGIHVLGAVTCDKLVQEAVRARADVVVCWEPLPGDELFSAVTLLQATQPTPMLVFTSDVRSESLERALATGVHAWVVNGYGANRLRPLVQLAQARFRHDRALRDALDDLEHRFEERKLVDRAKGILMRAHQVSEEEAFRRLRRAAMQAKQRVGQVSQRLIQAAHDAEGVNRAGQLRMLSQRIVKLCALGVADDDARDAQALLAQSCERVRSNLDQLSHALSSATFGDLLDAVLAAWHALEPMLSVPVTGDLARVDAYAETMLAEAERLTTALEAASPIAMVKVVNLAGRQRMLSQRVAKQALLGVLLDGERAAAARADVHSTISAFEQALRHLADVPLSSAEIRVDLGVAGREWKTMLDGVRHAGSADGRRQLAASSEQLLGVFEQLTERYERGVQLLLA